MGLRGCDLKTAAGSAQIVPGTNKVAPSSRGNNRPLLMLPVAILRGTITQP
jgi:hypothetical protein